MLALLTGACQSASPTITDGDSAEELPTEVVAEARSESDEGDAEADDDAGSETDGDNDSAQEAPTATPAPSSNETARVDDERVRWASDLEPSPPNPEAWSVRPELDERAVEQRLDNGLRVIVQRNTAPGSQAQLRLVVDAGSLEEAPEHLGVAHFLEHMMFNGTERFPGNELVPVLESFGAGFGPDVNAYTSYGETVYQLTVPTNTPGSLDLGLEVLAEWASSATIEPDAVVAERGVVREEWRERVESVSGRISAQVREVVLADSAYLGREPIGTIESIDGMQAAELRDFYTTWYRPDLMTVIVVGDVDVSATVRLVEQAFAGLPAAPPGAPDPVVDSASGPLDEPVFDVIVDPEIARTDVEIVWRLDSGPVITADDLHRELRRSIALSVLDRRLFEASELGESPVSSAFARLSGLTTNLSLVSIEARSDVSLVAPSLADLLTRVEQVRQHGLGDGELERSKSRVRTGIEQQFAESARVQDTRLAATYVAYALGSRSVVDPQLERDIALEVVDSVTEDDVRRFFDDILSTPPYVVVTAPKASEELLPEPSELAQVVDETVGWQVEPPTPTAAPPDQLVVAPEPAPELSRERIDALDATIVTFDNGARVAVRPTNIVESRVEFQAWSRGGFFQETGPVVPLLGRASALVMPSGFESVDPVALERSLGDQVVSFAADVGRATETMSGQASPDDLETLFQLLYLHMTEPTITEVSLRRFDEVWRPLAVEPGVRPGLAADLELWTQRYGDSPYFRLVPTLADLNGLDPAAQLDAWKLRFADAADFVYVFVGDVDPDRIFELAARYIGTLPSTDVREQPIDRDPGIPEENIISTVSVGVGDQGRLRINWESPYPSSLDAHIAAQALEIVVDARLRDLVREELGASYAPSAAVTLLEEPKPWVDTIIELNGDPDRLDEVSEVIRAELARIRAGDLDPGYLDRAIEQLAEDFRFFSNPEWIELVTFHMVNPDRPADEFRQRDGIARALTIDDIAEAAAIVFPETRSVEVRLVPATS